MAIESALIVLTEYEDVVEVLVEFTLGDSWEYNDVDVSVSDDKGPKIGVLDCEPEKMGDPDISEDSNTNGDEAGEVQGVLGHSNGG